MIEGIVTKGYSGFYYVFNKGKLWECSLRGKFRLSKKPALAGDRVLIKETGRDKGVIEEILPRKTELERPPVANVEMVVVLMAAKDPALNRQLLDRMLLLAGHAGLDTVICINKTDLVELDYPQELKEIYEKAGYQVIISSVITGMGINELRDSLTAKISVIAGPSGAGKSSLLNAVQPGLSLKTGAVSNKIGRGRHTTRHVELLPLDTGGLIADTPGFSSLELPPVTEPELAQLFPEFENFENDCKFTGCLHKAEPQCAVKSAVARGAINEERYQSYLYFLEELASRQRRQY